MGEKNKTLYWAAGMVSFSAIAYELMLATYATFLLGSTIFQYTLVFSVMMAAMGIGSYFAGAFEGNAHKTFLLSELLLSLLALFSIPLLYWIFSIQIATQAILILLVIFFGLLIGLEVPLLNLIKTSEGTVSKVLFSDYLGGFAGGLFFPLLFLPTLGFFRASALLACLNIGISLWFLFVFKIHLKKEFRLLQFTFWICLLIAFFYFLFGEVLRHFLENQFFGIVS